MFQTVHIDEHIRDSVENEGAVLLHLDRGRYFSLNGIGAEIWAALSEGLGAEGLLDRLQEKYGQPRGLLEKDVQSFLQRLESLELIHVER